MTKRNPDAKTGRPLTAEAPRNRSLRIPVSPAEHAEIIAAAAKAGRRKTPFLRDFILAGIRRAP